jgi:hypothetical protein
MMVSTTAARSTLGHAVTVVLMGTSSAKHDGDGGYNLDLVTPRVHCHHLIDGSTSCVHGGARAKSLTSASTLINDGGLTAAVNAQPHHWPMSQCYLASSAPALEHYWLAHWQQVLDILMLQRGNCCWIHPIVYGCPLGGRPRFPGR